MTVEIGGILRGIDCQRRNKYYEISRYCVDFDESLPLRHFSSCCKTFPFGVTCACKCSATYRWSGDCQSDVII